MCVCVCVCVRLWLMASAPLPPPLPSPFLFLFNVTGLAHMTLSDSVGTARARVASPAGALELDLQDKKIKRGEKNPLSQADRHLFSPPSPISLPLSHLSFPSFSTTLIQSVPLVICSPRWREIYRDAVSLTSLSVRDRNRISKCLTGACGFIFNLLLPYAQARCHFREGDSTGGQEGAALGNTPV